MALEVKNSPADAGVVGSVPGLGRSSGGGNRPHSGNLDWRTPWAQELGGPIGKSGSVSLSCF